MKTKSFVLLHLIFAGILLSTTVPGLALALYFQADPYLVLRAGVLFCCILLALFSNGENANKSTNVTNITIRFRAGKVFLQRAIRQVLCFSYITGAFVFCLCRTYGSPELPFSDLTPVFVLAYLLFLRIGYLNLFPPYAQKKTAVKVLLIVAAAVGGVLFLAAQGSITVNDETVLFLGQTGATILWSVVFGLALLFWLVTLPIGYARYVLAFRYAGTAKDEQ